MCSVNPKCREIRHPGEALYNSEAGQAGTQRIENRQRHWVPAFAGTTGSEVLNFK
jgi:hypothetical protein